MPDASRSHGSEAPGLKCSRKFRKQTECWYCNADGAYRICFGCMRALYCDKFCQKCGWKAADGHRAECLQWAVDKNCRYCNNAGAECTCVVLRATRRGIATRLAARKAAKVKANVRLHTASSLVAIDSVLMRCSFSSSQFYRNFGRAHDQQ